ncbi:MAG: hypothetical protein E7Z69_03125 [Thermoplasmata archaeon]|jgi:hypothetical protein|nr:hypothetical protein [Thermoplasmata archaeon]
MDKKIAIIAVVAVAIVAVAACVLVFGKSSNPTFAQVEIDEELQGKFYVVNGDGSESAVLEKGVKTYKDTKIVSEGVIWMEGSIVVDHDAATVTATMVLLGGNHDVEISFGHVDDLDASFVAGDLEIPLEGIEKGVSVGIDFDPPMPIEKMFAGTWNLVEANSGYYDDEGNPQYRAIDLAGKAVIKAIDDAFCTLTFNDHVSTCVFDGNHLLTTDVGGFSSTAVASALGDVMYIGHVMPGYGGTVLKFEREEGPAPLASDKAGDIPEPYIPDEGTVMDAFIAEKYTIGRPTDYMDRGYRLTVQKVEDGMLFYTVEFTVDDVLNMFHFVAVRVMAETFLAICEEPSEGGKAFVDMLNFTDGVAYTNSYVNDGFLPSIWNVVYGDEDKAFTLETYMTEWTYVGSERNIIHDGGIVPLEPTTVSVSLQVMDQNNNLIEVDSRTQDETPALWGALVLPDPTGYYMTVESFSLYGKEMFTGFYLCSMDEAMENLVVFGCLDGDEGSFAVFKQELYHTFG